jgi:hypothetical protein
MPGLRQYTGESDRFPASSQPTAVIVTPRNRLTKMPGTYEFPDKVALIEAKLRAIMPYITIQPGGDYTAQKLDRAQANLAAGKVLFQYDPSQVPCGSDPPTPQKAMFRVWVQDGPRPVLEKE